MIKNQSTTEPHHRRPSSIGGSDAPSNCSNVVHRLHMHWHTLFGNMNAEQICNEINMSEWKPKGVTVVCKFINGREVESRGKHCSKKPRKRSNAWQALFKDLSFLEIIDYINSTWLDPSYHFYLYD